MTDYEKPDYRLIWRAVDILSNNRIVDLRAYNYHLFRTGREAKLEKNNYINNITTFFKD